MLLCIALGSECVEFLTSCFVQSPKSAYFLISAGALGTTGRGCCLCRYFEARSRYIRTFPKRNMSSHFPVLRNALHIGIFHWLIFWLIWLAVWWWLLGDDLGACGDLSASFSAFMFYLPFKFGV